MCNCQLQLNVYTCLSIFQFNYGVFCYVHVYGHNVRCQIFDANMHIYNNYKPKYLVSPLVYN